MKPLMTFYKLFLDYFHKLSRIAYENNLIFSDKNSLYINTYIIRSYAISVELNYLSEQGPNTNGDVFFCLSFKQLHLKVVTCALLVVFFRLVKV
jgi:hypothetical protein